MRLKKVKAINHSSIAIQMQIFYQLHCAAIGYAPFFKAFARLDSCIADENFGIDIEFQ